jgi:hypothetical protein
MSRNPVIGYVAFKKQMEVFCDGPSCLVVGSELKMKSLLEMRGLRPADFSIRKTRFDDIVAGLKLGGEYGFEEEAYRRFSPSGEEIGMESVEFDFTPSEPGKVKFINIKIKPKTWPN